MDPTRPSPLSRPPDDNIRSLGLDSIKSLENDLMNIVYTPKGTDPFIIDGQISPTLTGNTTQFTIETMNIDQPGLDLAGSSPGSLTSSVPQSQTTENPFKCCFRPSLQRIQPIKTEPYSEYSLKSGSSKLLPPQCKEDKGKITLVLDLDETLVHSTFMAIPHADFSFTIGLQGNSLGVFVCVRPGTTRLLEELGPLYEIVIFTASNQYYADCILDYIDPDRHAKYRLYRESCTDFNGCFVKDLSKLGRDLQKVIIVDNSSVAYLLHPYKAYAIGSWYDDPSDRELDTLKMFLIENHNVSNIYDILNVK